MSTETRPSVDALLTEAADWHARMDCGTADIIDFEQWRDADPRHAAAFARVAGTAEQVRELRMPIMQAERVRRADQTRVSRRGFLAAGVGGVAAVALGAGTFTILRGQRANAETAIGGHETRRLPDGGQLDINTNSKVQWRFDREERSVWLQRGEIAMVVPIDQRPLCLYAAGKKVTLAAGQLNARLREGALDLLMLGGACVVAPESEKSRSTATGVAVKVQGGEAVLANVTGARVRIMAPSDIQFVSSWPTGQLVFSGETLGTAIEEYNRYLTKKITIGDPSLQAIRLGGRFSSHDPSDFLASLHAGFGINVAKGEDGSVILTR